MSNIERIFSLVCGIIMICFGLVYGGFQTYRFIQKTEEHERNKETEKPEVIYLVLAIVTAFSLTYVGARWIQEYTFSSSSIDINAKTIQTTSNDDSSSRVLSVGNGIVKIDYGNNGIVVKAPTQVYDMSNAPIGGGINNPNDAEDSYVPLREDLLPAPTPIVRTAPEPDKAIANDPVNDDSFDPNSI